MAKQSRSKMVKVPIGALRPFAVGNAAGSVVVFLLLLFAVLTWFAGFNPTPILEDYPLEFSFNDWTIILGLIEGYVFGYVAGWIFARIYNRSLFE